MENLINKVLNQRKVKNVNIGHVHALKLFEDYSYV